MLGADWQNQHSVFILHKKLLLTAAYLDHTARDRRFDRNCNIGGTVIGIINIEAHHRLESK